jgi:predicted LPLAT superfamily acyltransferase
MKLILLGVAVGALLPVLLAVADAWLTRRRQRRLARNYLRRTFPVHSDG